MAKNDLILLDGILDDYLAQKRPSEKSDEVFEFFATEQMLKDYAFTTEQLLSGSVDGRNDGGIDEFFVLVNGHLAENIPADYWPKSNAELEIFIVTCKHDDSFKQVPINTMIPSLIELFDFSIPSSVLENSYNERVLKKRSLFYSTYKRLATALERFSIHIVYACRGDEKIETNIQAKADQAKQICNEAFSDCSVDFTFLGNLSLLSLYRKHPNQIIELKYSQCINQEGQYIVLASLESYFNFICHENGKLDRRLFDSNVRDYLGLNPVNSDIQETLEDENSPNFWWLNNGITVLGTEAHIVGNTISISNVQIVNGLQTSESIYKYFLALKQNQTPSSDQRSVLIKIIITTDSQISDSIIYATNNQTNVNVTALRSTDKIQRDIEEVLKAHSIYYDRRTNFYQNQGIPNSDIVSPLALAAGCICLIYKSPHIAAGLKQKFMRNDVKYRAVFSTSMDLNIWVSIATLLMLTDKHLMAIKPQVAKNETKYLKTFRHIVMFITISRLIGTFAFSERQLICFDTNLYTEEAVKKSILDLLEIEGTCLSKIQKLSASFCSNAIDYAAKKYSIRSIQAISSISEKLWPEELVLSNLGLTPEMLTQVFEHLPKQPWPLATHKKVAEELHFDEYLVSNAISYLVYIGKFNNQVYGFVFDSEEKIIAEGPHGKHTETEARESLSKQKEYQKRRYKFQY